MDSKFFDIPLLSRSLDSDFICKDGELEYDFSPEGSGLTLPPAPQVDFALVRTVLPGWHLIPDNFPMKTMVASDPSMEYWTPLVSRLLSQFQSEATLQNLFVAPFMVMAAWKTNYGRYLCPTDPVKLVPNSDVPLVATDGDIRSQELDFKIAAAVCSIYLKMKAPEALRDWVGKITGLEILVSNPLHSYDTYNLFIPGRHVNNDSYCESLDLVSGEIAARRICTETLSLAWKTSMKETRTEVKFRPFAFIPLSEVDLAYDWTSTVKDKGIVEIISGPAESLDNEEIALSSQGDKKPVRIIVEGKGEEIMVRTRPLKLSGAGVLKMARRCHLRGKFSPGELTLTVFGSRDMIKWWPIAKRKGGTMVSLPCSSFRFYQTEISGLLRAGENLQGLVFTI